MAIIVDTDAVCYHGNEGIYNTIYIRAIVLKAERNGCIAVIDLTVLSLEQRSSKCNELMNKSL